MVTMMVSTSPFAPVDREALVDGTGVGVGWAEVCAGGAEVGGGAEEVSAGRLEVLDVVAEVDSEVEVEVGGFADVGVG